MGLVRVNLNGHPTWVKLREGHGEDLVVLHGGLSSSASLRDAIGGRLRRRFRVSYFDRRGHGRTADTAEPFHYDAMVDETIAFLERLGHRAHLLGHSDGGIVALLTALRRPDLVRRIVAVGANTRPSGLAPAPAFPLEGPDFEAWALAFGARSPDGVGHARIVAEKSVHLFATEPDLDPGVLAGLAAPTLLMVGDDDSTRLEHAVEMYDALPDGQLCVLPGASHGLLKEYPGLSVRIITRFLTGPVPPPTRQPIRRRPPEPIG